MTLAWLQGAPGPWPFSGAACGRVAGLAWAGRVGAGEGPRRAWLAARALDGAVAEAAREPGPRALRLSRVWAAVGRIDPLRLGAAGGADLALLLVAWEEDGAAVSAVGLGALLAAGPGPARAWLPESHPIFGPPGRPASRPGALSVERAPPILVGVAAGEAVAVAGLDPARLGPYCGVPDALERTP